jgi:uncharacterized protein (TIGR00251 family)
MKILIKVNPNSKIDSVVKKDDGSFSLKVKAPAKEGKANKAIINILAKYFGVSKSSISIKAGHSSKNKIVEIA